MAVVKMRAMNTHEPVYFDSSDLSSAEVSHNMGRQNTPQHYVCPITARVTRKGVSSGTYICIESVEVLETLFAPDLMIAACKEDFGVDPNGVKIVRIEV